MQDVTPPSLIAKRAGRRQTLLEAVDGLARKVEGNDQIATYDEFHQRAAAMILSSEARRPSPSTRRATGSATATAATRSARAACSARRLIERGVRFVTVNFGGWDHHAKIFDSLDKQAAGFDHGFSALIDDMDDARPAGRHAGACAMGEFGRTPKINKDVGRDHWAPAGSLLFAGAGVAAARSRRDRQAGRLRDAPPRGAGRRGLHRLRFARHRPAQTARRARRPADRDLGSGRGGRRHLFGFQVTMSTPLMSWFDAFSGSRASTTPAHSRK